jgi:arylsulfatase A-like enzyme
MFEIQPSSGFRWIARNGVLAIFGVLMGCQGEADRQRSPVAAPKEAPPVVIYLVDTLRADRLGVYGSDKDTSPALDSLAAESVIFEQAYSAAPWTLPSVTSVITSTFSCEHGMLVPTSKLSPNIVTLAEHMRQAKYRTGAYYTNPMIGVVDSGMDRGYEAFVLEEADPVERNNFRAHAREFFSAVQNQPFFLYLHTIETHGIQHTPDHFIDLMGRVDADVMRKIYGALQNMNYHYREDFRSGQPLGTTDNTDSQLTTHRALEALKPDFNLIYNASVRWADDNVAGMIEELKTAGLWDKALFIFMSDHGEEIGDHGGWFHGQSVYEELVHVPLIMHFPGDQYAGERIQIPVSLVDVMPTILDFIGRPDQCPTCRGRSLLPLLGAKPDQPPALRVIPSMRFNQQGYFKPSAESRGNLNVVIRQGDWKGIWNAEVENTELYNLNEDEFEAQNIEAGNQDLAGQHAAAGRQWLENCFANGQPADDSNELDEATKEKLRALGYFN